MSDIDVCCIISEAKCCSANIAAEYTALYTTGTDSQKAMYELKVLNSFIRALERYVDQKEKFFNKKEKCLPLGTRDWIRHHGVCLQADDLLKIIEGIKILCSNCNCNCK